MTQIEIKNESNREFIDISSEEWRVYDFIKDGKSISVNINNPQWLSIARNGHYLLDGKGVSHYIPYGWVCLSWKSDPHFVR